MNCSHSSALRTPYWKTFTGVSFQWKASNKLTWLISFYFKWRLFRATLYAVYRAVHNKHIQKNFVGCNFGEYGNSAKKKLQKKHLSSFPGYDVSNVELGTFHGRLNAGLLFPSIHSFFSNEYLTSTGKEQSISVSNLRHWR